MIRIRRCNKRRNKRIKELVGVGNRVEEVINDRIM